MEILRSKSDNKFVSIKVAASFEQIFIRKGFKWMNEFWKSERNSQVVLFMKKSDFTSQTTSGRLKLYETI